MLQRLQTFQVNTDQLHPRLTQSITNNIPGSLEALNLHFGVYPDFEPTEFASLESVPSYCRLNVVTWPIVGPEMMVSDAKIRQRCGSAANTLTLKRGHTVSVTNIREAAGDNVSYKSSVFQFK